MLALIWPAMVVPASSSPSARASRRVSSACPMASPSTATGSLAAVTPRLSMSKRRWLSVATPTLKASPAIAPNSFGRPTLAVLASPASEPVSLEFAASSASWSWALVMAARASA
ncbi:hypothetical protein D3C86_1930650 [compost metagenome]